MILFKLNKIFRFLVFLINRKQRQKSAPSKFQRKPEIEKLKHDIELKKTERLSRQQQIRENLSSLSMASVPSSGRNTSFVRNLILISFFKSQLSRFHRDLVQNGIALINWKSHVIKHKSASHHLFLPKRYSREICINTFFCFE